MRLKLVTTALLLFGLAMAVMWPTFVGPVPKDRPIPMGDPPAAKAELQKNLRAKREYLARSGIYLMVLVVDFAATAVLALIVARKAREQFREEAVANMKSLLEATLQDHRRKNVEEHPDR